MSNDKNDLAWKTAFRLIQSMYEYDWSEYRTVPYREDFTPMVYTGETIKIKQQQTCVCSE